MKERIHFIVISAMLISVLMTLNSVSSNAFVSSPNKVATCIFRNTYYAGDCKQNVSVDDSGSATLACQQLLTCLIYFVWNPFAMRPQSEVAGNLLELLLKTS